MVVIRPFSKHSIATRRLGVVLLGLVLPSGCTLPDSQPVMPPTRFDHLVRLYPELRGGRFAIIADFEDPKHMELFRVLGVSQRAHSVLSPNLGRPETGPAALVFTAGSPADAIVVSNAHASHWYLKRDWRDYDLFLMSLYAPQRGLTAELTIVGGPRKDRRTTRATMPLREGWNVLRLDLGLIGERIPLDDVRELWLAVSGLSQPVALRIDDMLLTGNRQELFGDAQHRDKGLYVQQIGRRWRIGAKGPQADFELAFAHGQIVEWYNVAVDPHRLVNLVKGTTLGPMPMGSGISNPVAPHSTRPNLEVLVHPRIVEMNAVRTVLTCDWNLWDHSVSDRVGADRLPFRRWVYTIYATGQIYVTVETTARTDSDSPPRLSVEVPLPLWPQESSRTVLSTKKATSHSATLLYGVPTAGERSEPKASAFADPRALKRPARLPAYAAARSSTSDAFLLYVVNERTGPVRMKELTRTADSPVALGPVPRSVSSLNHARGFRSFIAVGSQGGGAVQRWTCHLLVGSSSAIPDAQARERALDYVQPTALDFEFGSLVTPEWNTLHPDAGWRSRLGPHGFDPGSGCYVIAPEKGRVRLTIDGSDHRRFSPVFQILGTAGQEAWVYVDQLLYRRVARDAAGNLIFQLPGIIEEPTLVEVLLRHR